jgi:hypothetical protein
MPDLEPGIQAAPSMIIRGRPELTPASDHEYVRMARGALLRRRPRGRRSTRSFFGGRLRRCSGRSVIGIWFSKSWIYGNNVQLGKEKQ